MMTGSITSCKKQMFVELNLELFIFQQNRFLIVNFVQMLEELEVMLIKCY